MVQNRQKVKVNPFNFWPKEPANSGIYPMYFLKKYTSIEAQAKIKTVFKTLQELFEGNLLFKIGRKSSKIRPVNTGIWLFARTNILYVFSQEIYVQWSSNQDENSFQGLKELLKGICYSKMSQNRQES